MMPEKPLHEQAMDSYNEAAKRGALGDMRLRDRWQHLAEFFLLGARMAANLEADEKRLREGKV